MSTTVKVKYDWHVGKDVRRYFARQRIYSDKLLKKKKKIHDSETTGNKEISTKFVNNHKNKVPSVRHGTLEKIFKRSGSR